MKKDILMELISLALENKPSNTVAESPFEIGKKYFIRTVTFYMVGELIEIYPNELVFKTASWIADTGRFADFLNSGEADEVEPIPGKYGIGRGAIVDWVEWSHSLPCNQK